MTGQTGHHLHDGQLDVWVSTKGGSVSAAFFEGTPVLVAAGGPDGRAACFPLVPFGNRVEFNSFSVGQDVFRFKPNSSDPLYVHGDGWLEDWTITDSNAQSIELSLRHPANDKTPYEYLARQRISVSAGCLSMELSVQNKATKPMPFGLGFHPFFVRTEAVTVKAAVQTFWTERQGHLPGPTAAIPADINLADGTTLPARFINNAFSGWDGRAEIIWPELGISADLEATPNNDVIMFYTPADRRDFFCLEPMTHLPNGHHLADFGGLVLLEHGQHLQSGFSIQFRKTSNG